MIVRLGKKSIPHTNDKSRLSDEKRLAQLSDSLQKKYQQVVDEPLPETLQMLIDALREAERRKDKNEN